MRRARRRSPRVERGVGLIEVLVAVLVLAVGFLAAGRMQVQSLRDAQNAYHTSQARLLLDDMMDRMRNNPSGVRAGGYDDRDTSVTVATDCLSASCSPIELAAYDLHVWRLAIDPGAGGTPLLPRAEDGTAALGAIAALPDGAYELSLSWKALVDGVLVDDGVSARFVPRSGS